MLLPILGDQYGRVLERGELASRTGTAGSSCATTTHRLPINLRQTPSLLRQTSMRSRAEMGEEASEPARVPEHPDGARNLPPATAARPRGDRRAAAREGSRARAPRASRRGVAAIRGTSTRLAAVNGHAWRSAQLRRAARAARGAGRIAWRTGARRRDEINYRRFFDINDLAGDPHGGPGGVRGHARPGPAG